GPPRGAQAGPQEPRRALDHARSRGRRGGGDLRLSALPEHALALERDAERELGPLMRALALLMLLAAGCGNAVLGIQLQLATKACPGALSDPQRDPALNVSQLRIRVSGDNLTPIPV